MGRSRAANRGGGDRYVHIERSTSPISCSDSRVPKDTSTAAADVEVAASALPGRCRHARAARRTCRWVVDSADSHFAFLYAAHIAERFEALAWSFRSSKSVIEVLYEGHADPLGNAVLIAAGTGLGIVLLRKHRRSPLYPGLLEAATRLRSAPPAQQVLASALIDEFGRADIERVVSGPGIAHIHRVLYPHQCETLTLMPLNENLPAAISFAALEADVCRDAARRAVRLADGASAAISR